MKQKLKAQLNNLPVLSGYLHDANIFIDTIKHDTNHRVFSMEIKRIAYEYAKKRKFLGLIPIVKYPAIISLLTISEVFEVDIFWLEDTFNGDVGYPHQFLEISQENDKKIEIFSDYFRIFLLPSNSTEIILEDISEPSEKNGMSDIGGSIFYGEEEIEKLKI